MRGALRSGLMEALWRWQPCTVDELAVRAHLARRAVELTLHALAAGGVVAEDAGGWTLQAPPTAWAGLVGFDQHICNFVETGAPTGADGDDRYADVLAVIGRFHEPVAAQFAPVAGQPGRTCARARCRHRTVVAGVARMRPDVDGPVVDLPPVAARLERELPSAPSPIASRVVPGTSDVELGERFDVIVIAGLCRLLSEDDNARLFARCRDWLAADGRLVICDALADTA